MKTKIASFLFLSIASFGLCAKQPEPKINEAKEICASFFGEMIDLIKTASLEDQSGDVIKISWKPNSSDQKVICTADLRAGKILEMAQGDDILNGSMLDEMVEMSEIFAQAKNGSYEKFSMLAKQNIASDFKDPQSAKFRNLFVSKQKDVKLPMLCGEIDGKNTDGVYVGFKRFFSSNRKMMKAIEGGPGFHDVYENVCGNKIKSVE